MSKTISRLTMPMRHWVVRQIAPTIYWQAMHSLYGCVPRPMIMAARYHFKDRPIIAAEIGVAEGYNADSMLDLLNLEQLFLIDPYMVYMQDGEVWTKFTGVEDEAHERLAKHPQITWVKKASEEAVKDIPELDLIYIDGNHQYEYVAHDIASYYTKVRSNGFFGGHDYALKYRGVIKAVDELVASKNLVLQQEREDWWIIKP